MKTKCIIVEDEPLAVDLLVTYLNNFPDIELVAKCENALKAFQVMKQRDIDLIFLDIQMPKLNGIDFLKTLTNPPKVIITTAYRDYALDGFELNVVDYLLKPISLDRFVKAIDKYYSSMQTKKTDAPSYMKEDSFIYIKSNRKFIKIFLKEIIYLESMKDYVVVNTANQKIITNEQISFFAENLPADLFVRIHRSYIVSIPKITSVTKSSIEIGKKELPIGRNYKNEVMKTLGLKIS